MPAPVCPLPFCFICDNLSNRSLELLCSQVCLSLSLCIVSDFGVGLEIPPHIQLSTQTVSVLHRFIFYLH